MFQGFTDETFEFFMAIQFNNNTEFFHGNHDWYVRAVRRPCLELASALSGVMVAIDDEMELRPDRMVSRINRDLRFSRDKSPYRDYMWLKMRRPEDADNRDRANLGFYFDIGARESSGLRRRLLTEPEAFLDLWRPLQNDFELHMNAFKRMKPPENLHPELLRWYPVRSFWFYHDIGDFALLKSPALLDLLADGYRRLAPMYRYLRDIPSESDEDLTKIVRDMT